MANREACEIYIEQEIESGLEDGKTPYQVGKELSDWVAKLFEVRIAPRTIEQRARRKDATNVAKKSNTVTNSAPYVPEEKSVTHPPTERGGARLGAGRPKKKAATPGTNTGEDKRNSEAFRIAYSAIAQLELIRPEDDFASEALDAVSSWCEEFSKKIKNKEV